MKDVFAFWGCGNGLLKSLQPHIRIISGVFLGCACLLVPLQTIGQTIFTISIAVCWTVLASVPGKMLFRCAIASVILFFPFLLLGPWMTVDSHSGSPMTDRFTQAGGIALRSTCMLFIVMSTIASLTMHDLHRGLVCLPVSRSLIALIMQLVNQTMLLAEETIRIIDVLRLRGASGVRSIRVLFSFSIVWMVRMLFRAERCAAVMAVRGYGIESAAKRHCGKLTLQEISILSITFLTFLISAIIRVECFL